MAKIIGISGSLRRESFIEAGDGIPPAARELKEQIAAADGLLLVTPEYNNSIPGVFKNAIDWPFPPASRCAAHFQRPTGRSPLFLTSC